MSLDMTTPIFNRKQVDELLRGLTTIGYAKFSEFPRDWQIHIGPGTIATVSFKGPVGADEWDALLAHIAFYKQWYKDTPSAKLSDLSSVIEELADRIVEEKSNGEQGQQS